METRAQAKRNQETGVEDNLDSRVERLESTIEAQNTKMERHIAEIF